jgi:pimeloyl-ACP methyl ester carboxylesterase
MISETDLDLGGGRALHVYDARPEETGPGAGPVVFWHHGTPNTGEPPEPLLPAGARQGIRWVSYDRPGYLSSTPRPGRDIASAAGYVATVADALGIDRFAVLGHSSGGAHALACAALLPDRVQAVICAAGLAPYTAEGLDWFAGMYAGGAAVLAAAAAGREALSEHLASTGYDPQMFTSADHTALTGNWAWLARIAGVASEAGPAGMIEDELANVAPWGFEPSQIRAPVLYVHGGQDRIAPAAHAQWLAGRTPGSELWLRPPDGHVSVLEAGPAALEWLCDLAA